jgi:hypothetical protein
VKWENLFSALVQTHTPTEQRLSLGLLHTREKFSQKEREASVRSGKLATRSSVYIPSCGFTFCSRKNQHQHRESTRIATFACSKFYHLEKALNYVCSCSKFQQLVTSLLKPYK